MNREAIGASGVARGRTRHARWAVAAAALLAVACAVSCSRGLRGDDAHPPRAAASPRRETSSQSASPRVHLGEASHGDVTYWRDVAPILARHCTGCHAPGAIAARSPLETYAQARARSAQIAEQTGSRAMPPWLPETRACRALREPRALADEDIARLSRWHAAGAPEGDRAEYVPPPAAGEPLPARADLTVAPPAPYTPVPSRGREDYHCFVMEPPLAAGRDVVAVRVTPGDARVVHHVILFEVRPEALARVRALDAAAPGPGYTCFGDVGIDPNIRAAAPGEALPFGFAVQMITGWAPGGVPTRLPAGTGVRLAAGSRLVMQVHYHVHAEDRGARDRTSVELFFAPRPVDTPAVWVPQAQLAFAVPPGVGPDDPRAVVRSSPLGVPIPVRVWGAAPHMHLRGHAIRADVLREDGSRECLIDIPRWDFHWQQSYFFAQPRTLAGGLSGRPERVQLTCVYDNRAQSQPRERGGERGRPRTLRWGEGTDDEMCLNFLYVTL